MLGRNPVNLDEFAEAMEARGLVIFPAVVDRALVDWMLEDLRSAYSLCRNVQMKNGVADKTEHTVHHVIGPGFGESFLEYLKVLPVRPYIERYFGGPFILNSFGGALNQAHSRSYAHEIHRDVRSFSKERPLLNTLVMLDDFTEDNGATYLLPGSHRFPTKPREEFFYQNAVRATGPAGTVLLFDSNVWHAGGDNLTDAPRRSVTPMFCRPWIKPQFDYCRAVGYGEVEKMDPQLRQLLGWNARIPDSLDAWYAPPERRAYRGDQG
jgi:hypothetical protein